MRKQLQARKRHVYNYMLETFYNVTELILIIEYVDYVQWSEI